MAPVRLWVELVQKLVRPLKASVKLGVRVVETVEVGIALLSYRELYLRLYLGLYLGLYFESFLESYPEFGWPRRPQRFWTNQPVQVLYLVAQLDAAQRTPTPSLVAEEGTFLKSLNGQQHDTLNRYSRYVFPIFQMCSALVGCL